MSVCSVSTIQAPFPQVTIRSSIEMDILQFKKVFFLSGNKNVFFLTYLKYHFRAIKKHCAWENKLPSLQESQPGALITRFCVVPLKFHKASCERGEIESSVRPPVTAPPRSPHSAKAPGSAAATFLASANTLIILLLTWPHPPRIYFTFDLECNILLCVSVSDLASLAAAATRATFPTLQTDLLEMEARAPPQCHIRVSHRVIYLWARYDLQGLSKTLLRMQTALSGAE